MLARERYLDAVRTGLTRWLAGKNPRARDLALSALGKPSAGVANETYLTDATWQEDGVAHAERLVVRVEPSASPVFPDYDLSKQSRILEALGPSNVPVAPVLGYEADVSFLGSPFYVMRRIEGQIPSEIPPYHAFGYCLELAPAARARMWRSGVETLARIHALDWERLGLRSLDVDQLDYYERFLAWGRSEKPQPILDATLVWLRAHRPASRRRTLCWGDSRLPNTIFRHEEVVAVLDWEMAFIGDPEADLGWWIFMDWSHSHGYGIPRLEGLPGPEETIRLYEEASGQCVEHFHYYEAFAAFRYGVITMRIARVMEAAGLSVEANYETDNPCTRRLADLLDLPPPSRRVRAVTDIGAITARVQFHLTGPGGRDWYLISDRGQVTPHEGTVPQPDTVLTVTATDWDAIQNGTLARTEAFLSGKLKVEGDMTLLMQLEAAITKLT